jgi:hypothetical protein
MTPSCEVVSLPEQASPLSNQSALFITSELLPLLASLFVKSASQLNQNIQGNALGFGLMLKGFSPAQIRAVVLELSEREPERFAPTPQELKKLCQQKGSVQNIRQSGFKVSLAAIEMGVYVELMNGKFTAETAGNILEQRIRNMGRRGAVVDRTQSFLPLKYALKQQITK